MLKMGNTASCVDCIWENAKREDIVPSQEVKKPRTFSTWAKYQYAKKAFEASANLHKAAKRLLLIEANKVRSNRQFTSAVRDEAEKYYWRTKDGN